MSYKTSYLGWMVFGVIESYHIHHHTVFYNSERFLSLWRPAESVRVRGRLQAYEDGLFKIFSSLFFLQSCCEE